MSSQDREQQSGVFGAFTQMCNNLSFILKEVAETSSVSGNHRPFFDTLKHLASIQEHATKMMKPLHDLFQVPHESAPATGSVPPAVKTTSTTGAALSRTRARDDEVPLAEPKTTHDKIESKQEDKRVFRLPSRDSSASEAPKPVLAIPRAKRAERNPMLPGLRNQKVYAWLTNLIRGVLDLHLDAAPRHIPCPLLRTVVSNFIQSIDDHTPAVIQDIFTDAVLWVNMRRPLMIPDTDAKIPPACRVVFWTRANTEMLEAPETIVCSCGSTSSIYCSCKHLQTAVADRSNQPLLPSRREEIHDLLTLLIDFIWNNNIAEQVNDVARTRNLALKDKRAKAAFASQDTSAAAEPEADPEAKQTADAKTVSSAVPRRRQKRKALHAVLAPSVLAASTDASERPSKRSKLDDPSAYQTSAVQDDADTLDE
jgi:hypothetical protein